MVLVKYLRVAVLLSAIATADVCSLAAASAEQDVQAMQAAFEGLWAPTNNMRLMVRSQSSRKMATGDKVREDQFDSIDLLTIVDKYGKQELGKHLDTNKWVRESELLVLPNLTLSKSGAGDVYAHVRDEGQDLPRQAGAICGYFASTRLTLPELLTTGHWEFSEVDGQPSRFRLSGSLLPLSDGNGNMTILLRQTAGDAIEIESIDTLIVSADSLATTSFKYDGFDYAQTDSGLPYLRSCHLTSWSEYQQDGVPCRNDFDVTTTVLEAVLDAGFTVADLQFDEPLSNGTPVVYVDADWLHYEWQGGKLVAVADPEEVKRLNAVRYSGERTGRRNSWIIGCVAVLMSIGIIAARRHSTACILMTVLLGGQAVSAQPADTASPPVTANLDEQSVDDPSVKPIGWDDPYCGIVCAYTALRHFNKPVEFTELLSTDYVGSWDGSTGTQVTSALSHHGLESIAMDRANPSTLAACTGPVILHTRSRTTPLYRHWVTYLGRQDGRLRILDPALGELLLTPSELQAQWNGLMIAPKESIPGRLSLWAATGSAFLPFLLVGSGVCWCLANIRAFSQHTARMTWNCGSKQVGTLGICGIVFGVGVSYLVPGGLNRSDAAVATIAGLHPAEFLRDASLEDVRSVVQTRPRDVVIVDCRNASSFQQGTIPGAINVAVSATVAAESEALAGLHKDHQLILFCQSEQCSYDELVARRLIGRGYQNLRMFHGGYRAWTNAYLPLESVNVESAVARTTNSAAAVIDAMSSTQERSE